MTRIAVDGLWRCLCPSIDNILLTCSRRSAAALHTARPRIRTKKPASSQLRNVHSSVKLSESATTSPQPPNFKPSWKPNRYIPQADPQGSSVDSVSPTDLISNPDARKQYDELEDVPIAVLNDRLWQMRVEEGAYKQIMFMVKYLVGSRGQKPNLVHYDALIRANADAENGSVKAVKDLLAELRESGIGLDSGIYHGVLEVLAVHPDYLLRNEILREMKDRWLSLTVDGFHSVIFGLLRDRQLEMAMDHLETMQSQNMHVQPWLYDIFIYQLGKAGELDEALRLMRYRVESRQKVIGMYIWYYLLDLFTSAYHYEGTKYVWLMKVSTSQINPPDGMLVNVLNTAARHPGGDPILATSALRILSQRRSALQVHHYEALLAAYTASSDIKTAFRVLGIMANAGQQPSTASTRPLYLHLKDDSKLCSKAWETLEELHAEGYNIQTSAANVVIEASMTLGQYNIAMDFYKKLHKICASGPDTTTFNILLQGISRLTSNRKEHAMFIASEMSALGVKPDIITYDRLILICMREVDYEDAMRYLDEMVTVGRNVDQAESVDGEREPQLKSSGWWLRPGTAAFLVRTCGVHGDPRAWEILDEMDRRGLPTYKLRAWVSTNFGKQQDDGENIQLDT
ncbi:hypothetical protein BP5796_01471 [Coleophoma crateriformis]|uniref:Pentatricopeptide repeat-containing protein-mitochondrial domain-containing protein n=1 Tax=Coleophoma crateriformis TaxID=565419 RepID=A0A3D8T0H6_9HELO|nr:hypothetical protein BP5796_01471 [Coleophoma crateriformis]